MSETMTEYERRMLALREREILALERRSRLLLCASGKHAFYRTYKKIGQYRCADCKTVREYGHYGPKGRNHGRR